MFSWITALRTCTRTGLAYKTCVLWASRYTPTETASRSFCVMPRGSDFVHSELFLSCNINSSDYMKNAIYISWKESLVRMRLVTFIASQLCNNFWHCFWKTRDIFRSVPFRYYPPCTASFASDIFPSHLFLTILLCQFKKQIVYTVYYIYIYIYKESCSFISPDRQTKRPTLKHSANYMEEFFLRGNKYGRAGAVIARCSAIDVVRSTARSPVLTRDSRDWLAIVERPSSSVAKHQCSCKRVGRFCETVPRSDGRSL